MKKTTIKRMGLNIVALGIGSILAFILLEIGLRIYNPFNSRVRGNRIILPVNKKYIFEDSGIRGTDRVINHSKNSIGFRGPELPEGGLERLLSIITVGGSTTECFYLSDGKGWPAVLGKYIEEDFNSVWMNNAGLDGHSTFVHTILMEDIIRKLKPRIVLFLIGGNEIGRDDLSEHVVSQIQGTLIFNSLEGFFKSASTHSEVASLMLNLYRYLKAKIKGLPHRNIDVKSLQHINTPDPDLSELLKFHSKTYIPDYEQRLRSMIRLAKKSQIEPVLITQPFLFGEGIDPITGIDMGTIMLN